MHQILKRNEGRKRGSNALYNKILNPHMKTKLLQQIQQQTPFLIGETSVLAVGTDLSLSDTDWSLAPACCCILVWPEQSKAAVRCQEASGGRQRGGQGEPKKHKWEMHWSWLEEQEKTQLFSELKGSKLQAMKILKDHSICSALSSVVETQPFRWLEVWKNYVWVLLVLQIRLFSSYSRCPPLAYAKIMLPAWSPIM